MIVLTDKDAEVVSTALQYAADTLILGGIVAPDERSTEGSLEYLRIKDLIDTTVAF